MKQLLDQPVQAAKAAPSQGRVSAEADTETPPSTPENAHVATMLPPDVIQPGELIILLLKPSAWFILLDSLRFIAGVAIVVLLLLWLRPAGLDKYLDQRDLILCGIAISGVRLFWQFLVWLSHVYVLTDRRIVRVQGVLRVHVFETSLKQIQHTVAYFSIRERLFGLGSIGFATAGTDRVDAWWRMIANPLEVHRIIGQTLSRYR
jgi:hypothetical protein